MSIYSDISKRIGWEPRKVTIPSIETAKELLEQIRTNHCQTSFETVFTIHRFAPSSETDDQFEAMQIIYEAFRKGCYIFH